MNDIAAAQIAEHVPRMYRVALRMLADADGAHDVVQEACLKALGRVHEFDGRAALATWLHRITVNCAVDAIRAEARSNSARDRLQADSAGQEPSHSPADRAELRELTGLAWRLVDQLPDDCRSPFVLTQLDGYSYDEAAEIENQPRGTVASRVFRAKKILLEQMTAPIGGRAKS
jgi:RNA polymerase sigma-70 factor (ECF subfamily)